MKDYYAFSATELLLSMSDKEQKVVHDFIAMLKDAKQKKGEDKAPPKQPKLKNDSPYTKNDTMRIIGQQNVYKYIDNEEISNGIQDITQARGYDLGRICDLVLDVFLFGCITGKREERAKKKSHHPNNHVKESSFF